MSELADKIALFQKKTGESVLESKKYIEKANGDIDLALNIYLEDKTQKVETPKVVEQEKHIDNSANPVSIVESPDDKKALKYKKMMKFGAIMASVAIVLFLVGIFFSIYALSKKKDHTFVILLANGIVGLGVTIYLIIVCNYRYSAFTKVEKECNVPIGRVYQELVANNWKADLAISQIKRDMSRK